MPISDPPTTPRWADVTDDVRQLIRQCLQDKFDLDLSVPHISHVVDDMIKERFKDYRGKLHQCYKQCVSHEEGALSAPPHVTHKDWRILCDRFSSDSFHKRSKINSDNKRKLEVNHVAGSKSFVRLRYDMRDSVTGQEQGQWTYTEGLTVGRRRDLGYILEPTRFGWRWTPYAVSLLPMVLSGVGQIS